MTVVSLLSSMAFASDKPVMDGVLVGVAAVAGGLVGGGVGAAGGFAAAEAGCGPDSECRSWSIIIAGGAAVGIDLGILGGSAIGAKLTRRKAGLPLLAAAGALAAGGLVSLVGVPLQSGGLAAGGYVGGTALAPVAAAVAAAVDQGPADSVVLIAPTSPGMLHLRVTGVF